MTHFTPAFELPSIFVMHGDRMLLLQRAPGKPFAKTWCRPGGVQEENETLMQAAIRELHEETGILATPDELAYHGFRNTRFPEFDFVCHRFLFQCGDLPDILLSQTEHTAFVWKTPEEALAMDLIYKEEHNIRDIFSL